MKVYDIPLIKVVLTIKYVAKKVCGNKARIGKRGRKGIAIYIRITILAYMILHELTPDRMERELKENKNVRRIVEAPWPVRSRTIREWRKRLGKMVERLIKKTYEIIAKAKKVRNSKSIVDTTEFSRERASRHYEKRIGRKKKRYAKVIAAYSAEVDAVYKVGVDYDSKHDTKMLEGILDDIALSGLFDGIVGDKGFDSGPLMQEALDKGLTPYIDVRGGKLEPKDGVRLISKRNFEALRAEVGNVRALVESLFCSVKAIAGDVVYSRSLEGFATEIAIRFLAYNVCVIIKLKLRRLRF